MNFSRIMLPNHDYSVPVCIMHQVLVCRCMNCEGASRNSMHMCITQYDTNVTNANICQAQVCTCRATLDHC